MNLDVKKFYRATNPSKTIDIKNPEDKKFYIDFSSVRGGEIIEELKNSILWSEDFTCNLFSGHVGCGKSTELLRLKKELEEAGFHVVYFESDEELDMGNVDISEILLAIARRVSESLEEEENARKSGGFQNLLENAKKLLLTEIQISTTASGEVNIPGLGELGLDFGEEGFKGSFSTVIGKMNATVKKNRDLQSRLRAYLEPKTEGILTILNQGLFLPSVAKLKEMGKEGLVVIVDNLDRLLKIEKAFKRFLPQYIFADRGTDLNRLQCHLIYTMPLALRYCDDYGLIKERFKSLPTILPMVPVKSRDGNIYPEGMKLLAEMIIARVPKSEKEEESKIIKQVFGSQSTLDYLCSMSGGHVRNLLIILNSWIRKSKTIPLSLDKLEEVIVEQRSEMIGSIIQDEWELIRRVQQEKQLAGEDDYDKLIHNRFVFEYRDRDGSWYDINPVLEQLL